MVDSSPSLDRVFSALSDHTRRTMLAALKDGERSIGDLAEPHAMTLAGASKHIKVLETAGLVRCERRGRSRICSLQAAPLAEAERWLETYAAFWSERLDLLEAALTEDAHREDL